MIQPLNCMMLRNFTALVFLLIGLSVNGQQTISTVTGIIIDAASKSPVEFANVELLKAADSLVVLGSITDSKGRFTI